MKYINCSIAECIERNRGRRIFVFGAGANLRFYESSDLQILSDNVVAVLDNGNAKEVMLNGKTLPVQNPECLKEEANCSVIITTSVYMVDMTKQLEKMQLSDGIELYIYPLMTLEGNYRLTEKERQIVFGRTGRQRIPKVIHAFWFSGSEKPYDYQKCIDSWKKCCPDYEIKEYNTENYDVTKHPFLKRAVEVGAWAYATDYARLDVLSQEGGIYMDMDVELLRPIDGLLKHEGVFSFFSDGAIDLAAFMVSKENPVPKKLIASYDTIPLPNTKKEFEQYYQPLQVMHELEKYGVRMNGRFQVIEGNLFLPRYLMMPLDCAIYKMNDNEDTFAVHRANAGWKDESYAAKKADRNQKFYERLRLLY